MVKKWCGRAPSSLTPVELKWVGGLSVENGEVQGAPSSIFTVSRDSIVPPATVLTLRYDKDKTCGAQSIRPSRLDGTWREKTSQRDTSSGVFGCRNLYASMTFCMVHHSVSLANEFPVLCEKAVRLTCTEKRPRWCRYRDTQRKWFRGLEEGACGAGGIRYWDFLMSFVHSTLVLRRWSTYGTYSTVMIHYQNHLLNCLWILRTPRRTLTYRSRG